jgi:hypothetical protein
MSSASNSRWKKMAARVSGQTPRRAPAGERRRWRDRDRHGLVASVHDRRAERLELARTYCQAVLSHDRRISLDGAPAEPVDGEAKELAAKQLAKLAARKASAKSAKKVAAHAAADVKPAPVPPAPARAPTSEELRTRVRAPLSRRSASRT